jgi:hypothetical protein
MLEPDDGFVSFCHKATSSNEEKMKLWGEMV